MPPGHNISNLTIWNRYIHEKTHKTRKKQFGLVKSCLKKHQRYPNEIPFQNVGNGKDVVPLNFNEVDITNSYPNIQFSWNKGIFPAPLKIK